MKNFFKKLKNKQWLAIGVFLFLFLLSFLFVLPAEASSAVGGWVTTFFGWIFSAIVYMLGLFLILLVRVLIYIAQFNNFINIHAVNLGWSMVRDLANMFFVVILLIIAFATILPGIEKYNYKKWLPKLILMAVLINFSKMICGLLIDMAQVVMLSFVNAFKDIAGLNVTHMLGIGDWSKMHRDGEISGWEVMGAYFLAVVYVVISIVVIGTMLMMLVMRIIMIWIYVILSPIAFLMQSFPGGESYASKWWTQFTNNLVVGPVLAFFIWLSFSVVSVDVSGTEVLGDKGGFDGTLQDGVESTIDGEDDHGFGSGDLMIQFIVSIGLLIGGLKVSQEIGGAAGSIAGKGMSRLNKMSVAAKKGAIGAGKSTAKFAGRKTLGGVSLAAQKIGPEGSWLKKTGDIGQAWRADIKTSRNKAKVEKRQKFLKNIGFGEDAADKYSEFLKDEKVRKVTARTSATAKGVGVGALAGSIIPGPGTAFGAAIGGVVGFGYSYGKGYLKNKAIKKRDTAYQEREVAENDLKAAKTPADKKNAQKKYNKANKKYEKYKKKADNLERSEYQSTVTTQKAAAKISKEPKSSRDLVKGLSKDAASLLQLKSGKFYGISSQDSQQFHNVDKFAADNPEGKQAREYYRDWLNGTGEYAPGNRLAGSKFDDSNNAHLRSTEDLMKGIAAYRKEGNDSIRLTDLIDDLDNKTLGDKVSDYEQKVEISYRRDDSDGQVYNKDFKPTDLEINSFSQGEEAKKFIGVNFDNLKNEDIDIDTKAYGGHIQKVTSDIRNALLNQVARAKNGLEQKKESGSINDKDYSSEMNDLNKTEERLNDKELKNISLINTNHPKFKREQKMTSLYHEEIHSAGMMNEDITEDTAKLLMENKLYGRNPKTGGRHAFEVGQIALKLENEGKSREDIAKTIEQEIKKRNKEEAGSRSERVMKLQTGEKETESQAFTSQQKNRKDSQESVSFDSSKLEDIMNRFSQKLETDLSGLSKNESKSSLIIKKEGTNVKFDQSKLLSSIKKAVNSGNEEVAKMLKKYNKTDNKIAKKVIMKELKDSLNN